MPTKRRFSSDSHEPPYELGEGVRVARESVLVSHQGRLGAASLPLLEMGGEEREGVAHVVLQQLFEGMSPVLPKLKPVPPPPLSGLGLVPAGFWGR